MAGDRIPARGKRLKLENLGAEVKNSQADIKSRVDKLQKDLIALRLQPPEPAAEAKVSPAAAPSVKAHAIEDDDVELEEIGGL